MEIGTKIIGNFGANIPLSFGEIVTISTYDTGAKAPEIKVKWENSSHTWLLISEVCTLELLPERGLSPIGYYTEDAYYEGKS